VPPTRTIRPIAARSEFELFAEDAAGHPIAVYGRHLFDEAPATFAPTDRAPVPANYAIGPGDELLVRVWGKVELQTDVKVDRNGQIFLPKIGTLSVAGLRFEQIESYIRSAIANLYKDFELNVAMGQLRSIQIFVLGSARQPGAYTVSSLSTLVDVLFASGGPSATGSMRRIQMRRGDRTITELDVYDLLRRGDKSHDVQLLPEDVIYIPPIGPQVAIIGSVKDPAIYEIKGNTPIDAALQEAGGLTSLASADRALLERVTDHRRRQVDEFALDPSGLQRTLSDGDILRVFPVSPKFENAVTLRGHVALPGRYLWRDAMRVSDLIPTREALLTRGYWNQQNFMGRTIPDDSNPPSEPPLFLNSTNAPGYANQNGRSNAQFYSDGQPYPFQQGYPGQSDYAGQPEFSRQPNLLSPNSFDSSGATSPFRRPREHWDQPNLSAQFNRSDVMADIDQASADINWNYAAIERRDDRDLSTRIIPFNLGNAINNPSSSDNQVLQTGDVITIYSRKDIPLPQDKHAAFVRVGGEVNAPGVYRIDPGETLREVVARAGGLTSHSYLYASQLTRESTRLAQEEQLRLSIAQMQRDVSGRYAAASSLAPTNAAEQQAQLSAQQAIINQLASVHPTGRIVLDMNSTAIAVSDIPEFPLEDGDSYFVPARLGTVQVAGAVYNESAFRYQAQKRLSAYLKDAGGPTRQADERRAFLVRADGTVVPRGRGGPWVDSGFESLTLLPGDAIIVPIKVRGPSSFMQQLPMLTQILSSAATTGAIIATR
jgi:protein involved in polysaccharide export with SLBB domain